MKSPRKFFRRFLKNKKAVSQILAAIMMIVMLTAAIGVVWGWLFPAYRRFQTNNALNSVTSYMLRIDEGVYSLLNEGTGSVTNLNIDPFFGYYQYVAGKNITLNFLDEDETFGSSYDYNGLGAFTYTIEGRDNSIIPTRTFEYLKGPSSQPLFFVNNTEMSIYQGLTNLTLSRPQNDLSIISLDYRVSIYYWYDQTNDILSISVNFIVIQIKTSQLLLSTYNIMKMSYNQTSILFTDTTTVSSDFYVEGSITSLDNPSAQRAMNFQIPVTVANYDVEIEIKASYILFYV